MTDPRLAILHKRGIKGEDARTSLEAFDYVLSTRKWSDIRAEAQQHARWGNRLTYLTSVFGNDAARVAAVLYMEEA